MTRLLALAIPLLLARAVAADAIELRRSVEAPDGPVRLADVATLDGERARALAGVVLVDSAQLLPRAGNDRRLDLALVRERLKEAPGVNWAFLALRGGDVRLIQRPDPKEPEAMPVETAREGASAGEPVETPVVPGTIRALARDMLLKILRVEPEDLRVGWPEADAELLDQPVAGRLVHIQPRGTSPRMPLVVTIYDGDRIVRDETVRAEIRVRRNVEVMARPVHRQTPLTAEDVTSRVMWLAPGVAPASDVVGQVTTRRLEPGSVVEAGDIAPPYVVERGEVVQLHCVSGGVVIKTAARARADARDGELVEVEMEPSGRRVMARMNGGGRAVLVVPATDLGPAPGADANQEVRP